MSFIPDIGADSKLPRPHRPPGRVLARLAILLVLIPLVAACGERGAGAASSHFRLASLDGGRLGPDDFEGRPVLLDFWATWCGPCRIQAEVLQAVYPDYHPLGLEILSIDVEEEEAQVRSFVEREGLPFPVLLDSRGEVSGDFDVLALPTVVLLDGAGNVVFHRAGVTSERELRKILDRYVGGSQASSEAQAPDEP